MSIAQNFPNIKPSLMLSFADTRQLDSRVTFTRSTPAVYYDGKTTAMAEQNLLLQSQTFGTTWGVNSASITSDTTTAPDGTTTADTLTSTGTDACLTYQAKPTSTAGTISCYIKKGTSNFAYMYVDNPSLTGNAAIFDINTGVVGSYSSTFTSTSIVSVGNGWYRCIATFTGISGTNIGIGVCDTSSTTTCTSGRTIYIWGAQLEQRSSATAYTATTTQAITNYIPVLLTAGGNQPRFDCNPTTGESLGLLIEEQRTNRCTDSTSLLATGAATVSATATVAPDGSTNCRVIKVPSGYAYTGGMSNVVGGSTTWTYSFYIKNYGVFSSGTSIVIGLAGPTNGYRVLVSNLNTTPTTSVSDAVNCTNTSSTVTSVGNGWYRVTATGTYSGAVDYNEFQFLAGVSGSIPNVFIWGMQLEAGAFATSYIPTTSASATRTADAASMTGTNFSSWYSAGEGTITASYYIGFTSGNRYVVSLDQNNNNYVEVLGNSTSNTSGLYNRVNGSLDVGFNGSTNVSLTSRNILAAAIKTNDFALCLNGTMQGTDINAILAPTLASLEIGRYNEGSPGGYFNGRISKIAYYPLRLSNTNLQALTS